ncbi:hypothetical protein BHE74_00038037 [Ensete ventricosum]|nr:hypothetical protein BHE74_00038037 [Ensete ventricosum]
MHPLRFPNSGIRAKVFVQKINFKLRVMRLNRVELFYALVVAFGSESRGCLRGRGGHMHVVYMQRWLATVRPPAGATDHGLATCKGQQATARPPTRGGHPRARPTASQPPGAVGNDQPVRTSRLRPARKGLPPTASPTANRGDIAGHRSGRPLAGRLSTAKGSRRLRRGSGESNIVRVKEG